MLWVIVGLMSPGTWNFRPLGAALLHRSLRPRISFFYTWVGHLLARLGAFVHEGRDSHIHAWQRRIREDVASHRYRWLHPDFFPLLF